jgi:hypothetical protein
MIELTPEETAQILRQRQAREPEIDERRADLLRQLDELNNYNRAGAHGPLPRGLDADTVALIKKVQNVGIRMTNVPHGISNPVHIPSRVAYEIIKAVRGDARPKAAPGGFKVPT